MIFKSRSQTKFDLIEYFAYALILKGSDTMTIGVISSFINSYSPDEVGGLSVIPASRSSGTISQYLLPIFDAFLV